MACSVKCGYGTTLSFESGFFANITEISVSLTRDDIEFTHMLSPSNAREFEPNCVYDPGTIELTMIYCPSAVAPPINSASSAFVITWPNGSTISGTGYLNAYEISTTFETRMEATATIKLTGPITFA